MAWVVVFGLCGSCEQRFGFNHEHVPSFDFGEGRGKQPICGACMTRINLIREGMGLPPHPIHPEAYEPEEVA